MRNFTSGTLTDAGGSILNAGVAMQSKLRDDILLNPAWALVEEFQSTGTIYNHVVLKNVMAASGLPKDWFIVISRQVSTGQLYLSAGEDYSTATRNLNHCTSYNTSSTQALDLATGLRTTIPIIGIGNGLNTASVGQPSSVPTAATYAWMVCTDTDHIVFKVGSTSVYWGAMTSLVKAPASDPMPLVFCILTGTSSQVNSQSTVPRLPGAVASPAPGYSYGVSDGLYASQSDQVGAWGNPLPYAASDRLQGQSPQAFEIPVTYYNQTQNVNNQGYLRGKYKKLLSIITPPVGTVPHDTFTIDGKTYAVVAAQSGNCVCVDTTAVA